MRSERKDGRVAASGGVVPKERKEIEARTESKARGATLERAEPFFVNFFFQ